MINQLTNNLWWVAAFSVIVPLACYAFYLCWKVWRQTIARPREGPKQATHTVHQQSQLVKQRRKSIYALSCAIEEQALTLTEGCMRISAVASQLGDMQSFRREFGVIARVAEETAHIPILQAWKDLSLAEKRKFDREREQIEHRYYDAVLSTLTRLKQNFKD